MEEGSAWVSCPFNKYKNTTGPGDCIPCPNQGATAALATTSASDCSAYYFFNFLSVMKLH